MRKAQILMNKPVYLGLSILDQIKTVMYEFENVLKMQNFVIWIQTASLFMYKRMIFTLQIYCRRC